MIQQALDKEAELKQITDTKDPAEQCAGIQGVLLRRSAQAEILLGQLRSPVHYKAFSAAYLIGELRLSDALPTLIETIDTKNLRIVTPGEEDPLWGTYPMAEAITRFGQEAVPLLLSSLSYNDDEPMKRRLCIDTLLQIQGPKFARFTVDDAIEKEADPVRKARLISVGQELQQRNDDQIAKKK